MEASAAQTEAASGADRAERIVEAMRASVAEVGIAGSTFERVAAKAGVSRGLLHYYFGTKERLLIEVIRRDTEDRIESLTAGLEAAGSVDEVIGAFAAAFARTTLEEQGYAYLVSEVFIAGRHKPEIRAALAELYDRGRTALRRGPAGEGAGGRAAACASTPRRSSPTCSAPATAP